MKEQELIEELRAEIKALRETIGTLREENRELRSRIKELEAQQEKKKQTSTIPVNRVSFKGKKYRRMK